MHSKERLQQHLFYLLVAATFVIILAFNYLTPLMSDDLSYGAQVNQATSIADLFVQEYNQYMTWIGRSVAHIILRLFLFVPGIVFKVANSLCYIALSLLIYHAGVSRRRHDPLMFLLVQIGLWLFSVDFRQTVLWETGACNYLWTTTIILGFMTLCRREYLRAAVGKTRPAAGQLPLAAGLFLFGIVAGWCSENTSGACLVYLLLLLFLTRREHRQILVPVVAGAIGNLIGLLFMVLAPGNALRSAQRAELHTGLFGMVSRFQKVTLIIRSYFFVLLAVYLLLWIAYWYLSTSQDTRAKWAVLRRPALYLFLFVITSYALILTSATQPRAFYGAGIFLLIGVLQLIRLLLDLATERGLAAPRILLYAGTGILAMYLGFVILDCGARVARIYRDVNERVSYIEAARDAGESEVTVAQVHVDFYNDYSAIAESELSEDPDYWTNVSYEEYYGVERIIALPYDAWAVQMGLETQEEADATADVLENDTDEAINHLPGWF